MSLTTCVVKWKFPIRCQGQTGDLSSSKRQLNSDFAFLEGTINKSFKTEVLRFENDSEIRRTL